MASLEILMVILLVISSAALLCVRSLAFAPTRISQFELMRRVVNNEDGASKIQNRQTVLPRLWGLKNILTIVFSILVTVLLLVLGGWLLGGFMSVIVLLTLEIISHNHRIIQFIEMMLKSRETSLVHFVSSDSYKWLSWFGASHVEVETAASSKDELRNILERSRGVETSEKKYLLRALSFSSVKVADVMTPKSMIDSIDINDGIGPLVMDALHKTGHSRFPVIDVDVDHVVGMLYLHDLITLRTSHSSVKSAMRPEVYYIREDQDLKHALHAFLRTHHHLFIVVNTFRETVGLLSLEDVIESMLGSEVVDEFDEFHDLRKVAQTNPRSNNEPKGKTDI